MNALLNLIYLKVSSWLSSLLVRGTISVTALLVVLTFSVAAEGAYLLEIDTDSLDDGVLTFNSNFTFGGDTTTASQSVTSTAYGTTGSDSIFGGDGVVLPDTYQYKYAPTSDIDNLVIPAGTDLGGGNLATGFVGGGLGTYRVYAIWPYTENVSGGLTRYTVSTAGDSFFIDIDQNNKGNNWILLGEIFFSDPTSAIVVTQESTINSFVSMRSYGLLFEAVPEPGTVSILGLGAFFLRRKRNR